MLAVQRRPLTPTKFRYGLDNILAEEMKVTSRENDKKLGMFAQISRRDLVQGAGLATASAAIAPLLSGCAQSEPPPTGPYPPGETGLRGNHVGSFEVAHDLGFAGRSDWGPLGTAETEAYDLIVVGGGLSGLSAAYFYRQKHADARVLILDNHDDFGGHAKRNEFEVAGKTLIGYGGTQTLQEPSSYPALVLEMLDELGVDLDLFETAYDTDFFKRHGLSGGLYFGKEAWGEDVMTPFDLGFFEDYIPVAPSPLSFEESIAKMPITDGAKAELLELFTTKEDRLPNLSLDEKWEYLAYTSYRDFLAQDIGITEPDVFKLLQDVAGDYGAGIEAIPAYGALTYTGLPGWDAAGLPPAPYFEPYIHHFPDGVSMVARLLVRALVEDAVPAGRPQDILTKPSDYSKLDLPGNSARIRLNSTVVKVEQPEDSTGAVEVTYVRDGIPYKVRSKDCVLACNHSMIPHICPTLPEAQKEALSFQEKSPILYTNVAVKNWRAWKDLGISSVVAPGSYYIHATVNFPVSMGDYQFAESPDEPVIIHLERFPHVNNQGLNAREQRRAGRRELLSTSFEEIERETRQQLAGMLGAHGFDPATDITAITVNRWGHGYAYSYNELFDDVYEDWNDERMPHMRAKQPFGNITIANSDAAAIALFYCAVEEAHRAVEELPV